MRRAALVQELSFAYGLGDYEPPGAAEARVIRGRQGRWSENQLSDEGRAVLGGWTLHEKLKDEAMAGYIDFRRSVEDVVVEHADTWLLWTERVGDTEGARRWAVIETGEPEHPDLDSLKRSLSELREVLVHWKLAPPTGAAPILGSFGAAVARGIFEAQRTYGRAKPSRLIAVPGLGGGSLLQGLAYAASTSRGSGTEPDLGESAGPQVVLPGQGRVGQYQMQDAQWWVLLRIGNVGLMKVAFGANKTYQEIQRSVQMTDQALGLEPKGR